MTRSELTVLLCNEITTVFAAAAQCVGYGMSDAEAIEAFTRTLDYVRRKGNVYEHEITPLPKGVA